MAENKKGKKYYWLRLQKDFFKRHDIRIIEAMPNGKDYVIFYLKLLVESVSHNGELRFSDTIPYSEEMLATVTDTNIDIVRSAMRVFQELDMIEILEDFTIYMSEVSKMIGEAQQDDHTRESTKNRVRNYRARQKLLLEQNNEDIQERYSNVTCNGELEIEIELEKELELEKENKKERIPKHKYGEYQHVKLTDDEYSRLIADFGESKTLAAIKKVDEYCEQHGKKYTNYNLTIRKWGFDGIGKEKVSDGSDTRNHVSYAEQYFAEQGITFEDDGNDTPFV